MRRNFYPDFKYLEGLLNWYFGDRVALEYVYRPGGDHTAYPEIIVSGQVVARGRIPADTVVKRLEEMGVQRQD